MRPALALLAVLFMLATSTPSRAELRKSEAEYWNETGLRLSDLDRLLQHEGCYNSDDNFIGCVEAVEATLRKSPAESETQNARDREGLDDSDHLVWPKLFEKLTDEQFEPLAKFKSVQIMHRTHLAPAQSTGELNRRQRFRQAARELKKTTEKSHVNFHKILKWISLHRNDGKNEAYHAANGVNAFYINAFDPHTLIWPMNEVADLDKGNAGTINDIGIDVVSEIDDHKRPTTWVREVYPGTPAARGGVRWLDIITAIDGVPVLTIQGGNPANVGAVAAKLQGTAGSSVSLTFTDGEKIYTKTFVREERDINTNVSATEVAKIERAHKFGYVKLDDFSQEDSCDDAAGAISDNQNTGAESLVFDLRGNPGGDVKIAQCIAGLFLGGGKTLITGEPFNRMDLPATAKFRRTEFKTYSYACARGIPKDQWDKCAVESAPLVKGPVIVLIDGRTASAAEIVASALQDHAQAEGLPIWLAGDQSYGKATIQSIYSFGKLGKDPNARSGDEERDKAAATFDYALAKGVDVALTTARFSRAGGKFFEGEGIEPDFQFKRKPGATPQKTELHEKDLYVNYIPPADDSKWTQLRGKEIKRLNDCVASTGLADFRYEDQSTHTGLSEPNYGLYQALDVIHCLFEPR